MPKDYAHRWTDKRIKKLEKRIKEEYSAAAREMREIAKERMADYAEERAKAKKALKEKRISKRKYRQTLSTLAVAKSRDRELLKALNSVARAPRASALKMIAAEAPEVYAENANFATFIVEKATRLDTAFTLIDTGTVRQLFKENPKLLPIIPDANVAKDTIWHTRKFTSSITQSVLLGESVPDAAARLTTVLDMDEAAAMRSARTALTAAENLGRMDSWRRAAELGIKGSKYWEATLDDRTRMSHRLLDGEEVALEDTFSNGLEEPGDPFGEPAEVYNCRCTMRWILDDVQQEPVERFSRLPEGISYDDWKKGHYRRTSGGKTIM